MSLRHDTRQAQQVVGRLVAYGERLGTETLLIAHDGHWEAMAHRQYHCGDNRHCLLVHHPTAASMQRYVADRSRLADALRGVGDARIREIVAGYNRAVADARNLRWPVDRREPLWCHVLPSLPSHLLTEAERTDSGFAAAVGPHMY